MRRIRRVVVASVLSLGGGLAPFGCASEREPEETIEGKAPADYREEMEQNIAQPVGGEAASPSP